MPSINTFIFFLFVFLLSHRTPRIFRDGQSCWSWQFTRLLHQLPQDTKCRTLCLYYWDPSANRQVQICPIHNLSSWVDDTSNVVKVSFIFEWSHLLTVCFSFFSIKVHPRTSPGQSILSWPATPLWAATPLPDSHPSTPCHWTMATLHPCTTPTSTLHPMPTALLEAANEAAWLAMLSAAVPLRVLTSRMTWVSAMAQTVRTPPPLCWEMEAWTGNFWPPLMGRISHRFPRCSPHFYPRRRGRRMGSIRWEQRLQPSVGFRVPTVGAPSVFPSPTFCLTSQLRCRALRHLCQVSYSPLMKLTASLVSHSLTTTHK